MATATPSSFGDLPADEPYPGVRRRVFDTDRATVTRYEFEAGAAFPLHRHPQQQITLIEAGEVEFTIDGSVERMGPGGFSVVEADVEHGITAGAEGARFVAIVIPARSSADAYTVTGGEE
jgi:quercetin dioxygenase-like cupin family protein